jgi:hypothetical protein
MYNDYGKTSCKINQAVSDFSDITLSTANTSLKARTPQRRKNHNNKSKLVPLSDLFSYFNSFTRSQKALGFVSDKLLSLNIMSL